MRGPQSLYPKHCSAAATFEKGILEITVPRSLRAAEKVRRIEVKGA